MKKYYTRACNFYYGQNSLNKVKKNLALPVCDNKYISFDTIEIITRENKKKINIKNIKFQSKFLKSKIEKDLNLITKKKDLKS